MSEETGAPAPIIVQHETLPIEAAQPVDVEALNEALPHLRRPFTPEAIRFKIQTQMGQSGAIIVAYIDARLVIERLNAVVGGAWTFEPHATTDAKLMFGHLTVFGIMRPDIGQSGKGLSKDLFSDSLKRAAVQFGVGVSVYSLPEIKLWMRDEQTVEEPALRTYKDGQGKERMELTPAGHRRLRGGYQRWLAETGVRLFGLPMDHGDVAGEKESGVNDPDAAGEAAEEPAAAPALPELTDERAEVLKEEARALYATVRETAAGRKRMPPGVFAAQLQAAHHSHADLEALVAGLQVMVGELGAGA